MSKSEFRWNKKRKHYSYLFKNKGLLVKNLLLHSDPSKANDWSEDKEKAFKKKHTKLYRHPNPSIDDKGTYYVENRIYVDVNKSFANRKYHWNWHKNDKRKIKRLKKDVELAN